MNYSKIRPLLNRVLVKRLAQPSKTTGGILLPEKSGAQLKVGMVTDVGPGRTHLSGFFVKTSLKPGDFVLLPDYGGVRVPKVNEKDEDFLIFQEEDILGVVNEKI
jgi:chaperonin GroES